MKRFILAAMLTLSALSFAAPAAHAGDGNEGGIDTRYWTYNGE